MRSVTGPTDKVVIVGAGLGGLARALRLAGTGRQVTAGTPFAAAHTFGQSGPLRPGNLAPGLDNVVFVGSGTWPGVGIPMVLVSARLAAERIGPPPSRKGELAPVAETGLSAGEAARRIGVAVTTIRTWDRRYGLGPSYREPGRHRRYSQDDLARLELMRRLTVDGVAPAEAARIAKAAADPLGQAPAETAGQLPVGASPELGRLSRPDARPPATARSLRRAALALDPADVDRLLELALARGVVPAWTTVIAPALRDLGSRYSIAGRYIAAEHLLSGAVSIALARVPRPVTRPQVLLACTPTDQHGLPLEALAAALAEHGAASRMLGARMPAHALQEALVRTGPAAVLIWAHSPATADYHQLAAAAGTRPRPAIVAACGPGWESASLPDGVLLMTSFQQALDAATRLPEP